jgi:hypothetical protein
MNKASRLIPCDADTFYAEEFAARRTTPSPHGVQRARIVLGLQAKRERQYKASKRSPYQCSYSSAGKDDLLSRGYTPANASQLNMVEIRFGILSRKSLRKKSFSGTEELAVHITRGKKSS